MYSPHEAEYGVWNFLTSLKLTSLKFNYIYIRRDVGIQSKDIILMIKPEKSYNHNYGILQ